MDELAKKIEAVLFVAGEGITIPRLAALFKKNDSDISVALEELQKHLEDGHFLTILRDRDRASIVTAASATKFVEDFAKEEFAGELTRAALEALTIIAYKGPVKRSDIDYIRGVNSSFIIRNLLMRGLVERVRDPKDSRAFLYRISAEFLKYLGVKSITDLPKYGMYTSELEEFLKENLKETAET